MSGRIWLAALVLSACKPEDDTGDTDDTDVPTIDEALDCGTLGPAGGIGEGTDLQRYNFDTTEFPDALCNDGTPAFFYYRPYDGAANADRWVIQLQGGGSCESPADCFERWCSVDTNFGMQGMTADESPQQGIGGRGILDRDVGAANPLGGFNQVFVRYCSSDSWGGTARDAVMTAPHPISGEDVPARLFFEGAHIVDAVLEVLRQDGQSAPIYTLGGGNDAMPDLDEAAVVLLAGASGGGGGTINNGDRVGEALRADNVDCQGATCDLEYRLLIDSIFFPDRSQFDYADTELCTDFDVCDYATHYGLVYESGSWDMTASLDEESCAAFHANDGLIWKCADNGHVVRNHVTTPMFVRMGLADELVSDIVIDAGFGIAGDPIDLPMFAQLVGTQLIALTDPGNAEEGAAFAVAPGVYGPTCAHHETLSHNPSVYDVTIDVDGEDTKMFQAMADWNAGPGPVAYVATGLADNFCPPD